MSSRRKSKKGKGESRTLHYVTTFLKKKTDVKRSSLIAKQQVQILLTTHEEKRAIEIINMAYVITRNSNRRTLFARDITLVSRRCEQFYK